MQTLKLRNTTPETIMNASKKLLYQYYAANDSHEGKQNLSVLVLKTFETWSEGDVRSKD